ncbi:Sad1 / UNC-like protein, partial [Dictyocaulus viviparus]
MTEMTERWYMKVILMYIAVFWPMVRGNNVCFADGFRTIVYTYLGNYGLSCPTEVSLQFDHKLPIRSKSTKRNSTNEKSSARKCTSDQSTSTLQFVYKIMCNFFLFMDMFSFRNPSTVLLPDTADEECSKRSSSESHQPIATFDEWTKEKLKQDHRKFSPSASEIGVPIFGSQQLSPSTATTRNYASKECGAKVLLSNPEAENTKAILSEKEKDEYMRNPCEKAGYKFVIIELCETIQLRSIELANYELFSSGPRTIRLWFAERFPAGEWQLITELTAIDSRQIQQFPISSNGIYIKFMKMELLSHYGNEHYCTLSVLKVLGTSMIDEYEAEAEAASVVHVRNNIASVLEKQINHTVVETAITTTTANSFVETELKDVFTSYSEASDAIHETLASSTVIGMVQETSGNPISQFMDISKDNLSGTTNGYYNISRKHEVINPFEVCYLCPKSGPYIHTSQFCSAFVWKVSRHDFKRNETDRSISVSRKSMSSGRFERSLFLFFMKKSPQTCPVSSKKDQLPADFDYMRTRNSSLKKESVFMKLNKRIAALELNMSLSSEYLSELSRQYVAQADEHHKRMKQAREIVNEAVEAVYARVNETFEKKV